LVWVVVYVVGGEREKKWIPLKTFPERNVRRLRHSFPQNGGKKLERRGKETPSKSSLSRKLKKRICEKKNGKFFTNREEGTSSEYRKGKVTFTADRKKKTCRKKKKKGGCSRSKGG